MVWPPQSPDLNSIEAMWDYVDSKLDRTQRSSQDCIWRNIEKTWKAILRKILRKYIFSMKKRCRAVLMPRRGHIHY